MSEPLTPDLERWARGSFSPMAQRHAWNEVDRLRDELRRLREGVELAHATICATVLGIITGAKVTRETEAEINRVVDVLTALLRAKETT